MADGTVRTFSDITERLDEIISQVRSKDTSLERSLDLFDEAIQLGSKAVELVDSFDMSPEESAMLEEAAEGSDVDETVASAAGVADADQSEEAPAAE